MATSPEPAVDAARTQQAADGGQAPGFQVHLTNFTGPFDLLLRLIGKHQLDITEVALAAVTDEFVAHLRGMDVWDLDQASEFLVVAATLLDLKAARLLPAGEVEDGDDLALLEARDLLFARLLQYRVYKLVAATFEQRFAAEALRVGRSVPLEPELAGLLPELVSFLSAGELALLAARASAPRPGPPEVGTEHLHAPVVSVAEQARHVGAQLRRRGSATFRDLVADAGSTPVVVGRFLALLDLFHQGLVAFEQVVPLGELTVRWTGPTADSTADSADGDADESDPTALPTEGALR